MLKRIKSRLRMEIARRLRRWVLHMSAEEKQMLQSRLGACGQGVNLQGYPKITGHQNIIIEDNVHIGEGAFIRGEGGLRIGANTHISRNVVIYTFNHAYEGALLPYDDQFLVKAVDIGPNCWIGMNVCIAPGTRIGEGCIIGIGTTVHGQIPPLSIIGNQKWRIINSRNQLHYDTLRSQNAFSGESGRPLSVHMSSAANHY